MTQFIEAADYWKINALSQSTLKNIESPQTDQTEYETTRRYFEEGNLVDAIVTNQVQDKYVVLQKIPNSQKALEVCEDIAKAHMDADLLDEDFLSREVVFNIFDEKKYYENIVDEEKRIAKLDPLMPYIKSLIIQLKTGLRVISQDEMDRINHCVRQFRDLNYISILEYSGYTIEYQKGILFEYNNVKCKALLDIVAINHDEKLIKPIDVKTTKERGYNFVSSVRRLRYDVQAYWYTMALQQAYPDYTIEPFLFIVLSKNLDESQSYVYSFDIESEAGTKTKDYIDQLMSYYIYREANPESNEEHILKAMYDIIPLDNLL